MHLTNYTLKLIHDPVARSTSNGICCRLQTRCLAQADDPLAELDLLSSHPFESRNQDLLFGVIPRQVANGCLALLGACYAGTVGIEIGFLASQCKSAIARFNTLHCGKQVLKFFKNLVSVSHPSVAFIGRDHGAIGDRAHDERSQNGGSERELYRTIQ